MQMSNREIVNNYKEAKDRTQQVKILADLNCCSIEQIIGILTSNGIDHRCFSGLRRKMNKEAVSEAEKVVSKIPYKKPEIIPGPPEPDKQPTVSDAVTVIKAEIADINRQQYELDMRKADLYKQVWDMMGEM